MEDPVSATLAAAPSSPTLTNPDMILPYGDYSRADTPSPPLQAMPLSPSSRASAGLNSHPPYAYMAHASENTPKLMGPFGAYGRGDGLYDIPEGDTIKRESTEGVPTGRTWSPTLPSSPVLPSERLADKESPSYQPNTSTLPGGFPVSAFDDSDEEAEEEDDEPEGDNGLGPAGNEDQDHRLSSVTIIEEDDDEQASAALSMQAEKILANAKKRLDNMEGNLSRARHSLIISPSSSMSPFSNSSFLPHTPRMSPGNESRRNNPPFGTPLSKHRQLHQSPSSSKSSPGHARVFSETSVPSSLYTTQRSPASEDSRARAQSASSGARGLETPNIAGILRLDKVDHVQGDWQPAQGAPRNYLNPFSSYGHPSSGSNFGTTNDRQPLSHGLGLRYLDPSASLSDINATTSPYDLNQSAGLSRSRSTNQIRDVRDQMKDLKGRISTLQQRARQESLKRRSLSSLRTPSPFTAAEQWYQGAHQYEGMPWSASAGVGKTDQWQDVPRSGEQALAEVNEERPFDGPEEPDFGLDEDEEIYPQPAPDPTAGTRDGDDVEGYDEDDEVDVAASDDGERILEDYANEYETSSLGDPQTDEEPDYHDAPAHPVGERHEDRPDAFDYEHFFLHSGMGNYGSTAGRRDSIISTDSAASVETARPVYGPSSPHDAPQPTQPSFFPSRTLHNRQASVESVSTVATFATATEGSPDADDYVDVDDARPWGAPSSFVPGTFPSHSPLVLSRAASVSHSRNNSGRNADTGVSPSTSTLPSTSIPTTPPPRRAAPPPPSQHPPSPPPLRSSILSHPSPPPRRHSLSSPLGSQTRPHPRPTSILLSSLAASKPSSDKPLLSDNEASAYDAHKTTVFTLRTEDRALVDGLVESLGRALKGGMMGLEMAVDGKGGDWRARVEGARRILDGEV
ncbi:MAG: hypothetical protein M1833_005398 [Piccolia ochrophora]|nr:MAG: hypothetical protein M1833_005398 [Piccolia ochrophora]